MFDYNCRLKTLVRDSDFGELLNVISVDTLFLTNSTLTSPWGISIPPLGKGSLMVHFVISGKLRIKLNSSETIVEEGGFVLVSSGEGHRLDDGSSSVYTKLVDLPIKLISERYEKLSFGGGGEETILLCGVMLYDNPFAKRIISLLDDLVIISKKELDVINSIAPLFNVLSEETLRLSVGSKALIARLAESLVILCLRKGFASLCKDKITWVNALSDGRVGRALELIHENPEVDWKLERLAAEAGLSKSGFSKSFKTLVGNTPMEYLAEWRISLAFSRLQASQDSIISIALDLGYQSESAFSRAFKRITGRCPSEVRKGSPNLQFT